MQHLRKQSQDVKYSEYLPGDALRILLSFNPDDVALAEAFRASLFVGSPDLEVCFSPVLFEEYRSLKLKLADAFVLFVGRHGLAGRQLHELDAAIDRARRNSEFAIVPILAANARAPKSLPCNLSWIEMPVVTDRTTMRQVIDALNRSCGLNGQPDPNRSEVNSERERFLRPRLG